MSVNDQPSLWNVPESRSAVVLLAHGARSDAWRQPFEQIVALMRAQGCNATLAFLEFLQPNLIDACLQLHARAGGAVTHFQIVPMFFASTGHVMRDLPELLATLRTQLPSVQFELLPAIGEMPPIQNAMADELVRVLSRGRQIANG